MYSSKHLLSSSIPSSSSFGGHSSPGTSAGKTPAWPQVKRRYLSPRSLSIRLRPVSAAEAEAPRATAARMILRSPQRNNLLKAFCVPAAGECGSGGGSGGSLLLPSSSSPTHPPGCGLRISGSFGTSSSKCGRRGGGGEGEEA